VHLAAILPGPRYSVQIEAPIPSIVFVGPPKGNNGQLLVIARGEEAMGTLPFWVCLALEKFAIVKANATENASNLILIESKTGLLLAICKPRHLCAQGPFRLRLSCREKLSTLAGIEEIILLCAIWNAWAHSQAPAILALQAIKAPGFSINDR